MIKGNKTLPGKGQFIDFVFYHVEIMMEGQTFNFVTTADHLTARED